MLKPLTLTLAMITAPSFVAAQSVEQQIVSQLAAQGFTRIEISRTLLGRTKLKAYSPNLERELVFNPATGEILRDYWEERDDRDDTGVTVQVADPTRGASSGARSSARDDDDDGGRDSKKGRSGSSGSGKDDDRDDDDDDDDDRDDDDDDDDDDEDDDDDDDDDDDKPSNKGKGKKDD